MKKKKGFTLIELLVVIAIIAMLLAILMPALGKVKKLAMRLVCGTNLKGMANALNVYAFDYRDEYPVQGGKGVNTWSATPDAYWDVPGFDWSVANNLTVTSSLFLLVREADVGVKSFVCGASDQQPFVNDTIHDIVELWDFGPGTWAAAGAGGPQRYESYSYQMPYMAFSLNYPADGTSNPGNAVMGDRNPWFDSKMTGVSGNASQWIENVWDINLADNTQKYEVQQGNAAAHDREGQNLLFNDGHVSFEKRPDVGTRYDNVYTMAGVSPAVTPIPDVPRRVGDHKQVIGVAAARNGEDSMLVNDDQCK